MNKRFHIAVLSLLFAGAVCASAQSAAEISAAKSMARSYGYTDSEVDAMLKQKKTSGTTQQKSAAPDAASAAAAGEVNPDEVRLTPPWMEEEPAKPHPPVEKDPKEAKADTTIYGHSYFKSKGLAVIPSYNAPAPAGYVLGPGDEVVLDVWGGTNSNLVAVIDNDGSINIPDLGPVYLSGMKVSDAESQLRSRLSSIYSGLRDGGDTSLRLSVGKIKGVVVNVIGEVAVPGAYTIPSLCSITSAIFMAGGVTEAATVRGIALYRGGRKISTFDLYEFILEGKYDANLRLQDGDIISVDPHKAVVKVTGGVVRPMRYEAKPDDNLLKLVGYAGGFTTYARRDEIHVTRRSVTDGGAAYDVKSSDFSSFRLADADEVNVRENPDIHTNTVTISGPVTYPGDYSISPSVRTLADLIKAAGGLKDGAYTGRGRIKRLDENLLPVSITFDLDKVLSGAEQVSLLREDSIFLYLHSELVAKDSVFVDGYVNKPGSFDYHEGMTVADAILLAKGVKNNSYSSRGHISRLNAQGVPQMIPFDVASALEGNDNVGLFRGDSVRVYSLSELIAEADVTIGGEVNKPLSAVYREGMTLRDLVMMAGGFTGGADLSNIEIATRGGRERGYALTCNLEEHPELENTALKPYDIVSVRKLTYFRPQTTVTVEGEALHSGSYTVDKAVVRLSDVVEKMGGFTDEAWVHGAKLTRVLTREEYKRQVEAIKVARQNLADGDTLVVALVDRYNIGIDLEKAVANPGCDDDIILRAGDIITIPAFNNTVKVTGGVYMPNVVTYIKGMTWRDYISQAGGFSRLARRGQVYVTYMNGRVSARSAGLKIEPGCEIVVPTKKESSIHHISAAEVASLATSTASLAAMIISIINIL